MKEARIAVHVHQVVQQIHQEVSKNNLYFFSYFNSFKGNFVTFCLHLK